MAFYGNYNDHFSEYDDELSMADSQTDLYSGYNNRFRPHYQDGSSVIDRPRKARKSGKSRSLLGRRRSSFVNQDYERENSSDMDYIYQQPHNSRSQPSFTGGDLRASPDEYQHYYHDQQQQQARRRDSHQLNNKQHYDCPITPEDERATYLYRDQPFAPSQEEIATSDDFYVLSESQNSEATLEDDDDTSFIEDTTTQRNTLINSESVHTTDSLYQKEAIIPSAGSTGSPQQSASPFAPYSLQQRETGAITDQRNNNADVANPVEKKKWFKSIINTALIIKKRAQKLKREDRNNLQQQQQQHAMYGNVSSPSIQVISAGNKDVLGDVLDSRQQQDLITQLSQSSSPVSGYNANLLPEKTKITSLDRIWVFRLQEETYSVTDHSNNKNIAWIGFDFENQLKIEQHIKELETKPEDGRLALYDSHIRHKTMPVIVTPNDCKGYYFADLHQNELVTLQITFIENDHQKVTFVYRI